MSSDWKKTTISSVSLITGLHADKIVTDKIEEGRPEFPVPQWGQTPQPRRLGRDFGPCRSQSIPARLCEEGPVPSLAAPPSGFFLAGEIHNSRGLKTCWGQRWCTVEMLWDVHEELRVYLFVTFLKLSATVQIMAKETFSEYRKIRNLIIPFLNTPPSSTSERGKIAGNW